LKAGTLNFTVKNYK
jgi:hypothetical protein